MIDPVADLTALRLTLRERGYCPVPISGPDMNVSSAGKRPTMAKWQTRCLDASPADIERWPRTEPGSVNTGLLTGTLAGTDIDILQEALAAAVEAHAMLCLGPTPLRRIGRAPKVLLCYRLALAIDKLSTPALFFTDDLDEKPTKVEILLRGQQFVGWGIHPETREPYAWSDASPLTIDFADVPEITEGALRGFLSEAEEIIREAGGRTRAEQKGEERKRESEGRRAAGMRAGDGPPDRDTVADALRAIPNDLEYDEWVRVGFALYAATGGTGQDLWEAWSAGSAKNDPGLTARKWRTFGQGRTISTATLFRFAKEAGWKRQGRSGAPKQDRAERRASADPEAEPETEDPRPIVRYVAGRVPNAVDRMEAILLRAKVEVFTRTSDLVRPVLEQVPAARGRLTTIARMRPLVPIGLADIAARIMRFQKFDGRAEDWLDVNPPTDMMAMMLEREGKWRLPSVVGIITTPTLRPDGSILDRPGYDAATRLYYAADPGFALPPIPERPSKVDAHRALAVLEELLPGFPFVGPVDRAVALCGILTALIRCVVPTAPLIVVNAHTPGTGKSYLVDVISAITTGRRCPVIAAGKTDEETEKRLGALLLGAVSMVSIDNVNGELGGDTLCQATERPLVRVRILGKSEMPEIECRAALFATGNNIAVVADMTRRVVICALDAGVERPELREFAFKPVDRVLADRGVYVAAALTVIRAYLVAGAPRVCGPIGSYEDWDTLARSPLVWLGGSDPVASMEAARDEDPERIAVRELFGHWREHLALSNGYTSNAIIKTACEKGPGSSFDYNVQEFRAPEFRDLLLRQAGEGGAVNSRRLGKWLSRIKGRVIDGHRIEVKEDTKHGNRFALCTNEPRDQRQHF